VSPDGRRLLSTHFDEPASAFRSGIFRIWEAATGRPMMAAGQPGIGIVDHQFIPPAWLIAQDECGTVTVRDAIDGSIRLTIGSDLVHTRKRSLVSSLDGRLLACGPVRDADAPAVQLWDISTGSPVATIDCAREPIAFSAHGRSLATGSADPVSPIRIWNTATGREMAHFGGEHVAQPIALAFSPDGRRLAAWPGIAPAKGHPRDITIWDLATGKPWVTLACPIGEARSGRVEFSRDGRLLVARDNGPGVFWDLSTSPPHCLDALLEGTAKLYGQPVRGDEYPLFSKDGSRFVVPGNGDEFSWVAYDSGSLVRIAECTWPYETVNSSAPKVSPDGRYLAQSANAQFNPPRPWETWLERQLGRPMPWRTGNSILIYDLTTGAIVGRSPGLEELLGFAPDGRSVWAYSNRTADGQPGLRVQQMSLPSWNPPAWLVVVTAAAIGFAILDWHRTRRRRLARLT
jgi:WD40 repeat protein